VSQVAKAVYRDLARRYRVHTALGELARPHFEVELDLFVDFPVDRYAPQPRTKGTLHVANTFDTPAENLRHVSTSAASCARPSSVRR
jgi:hypothetical protein